MTVSTHELYWAAGFLEGEGCFTMQGRAKTTPLVTASQVELEPLDRLVDLFGGRIYEQENNKVKGNLFNHWYLGSSVSVQVMMTLYTLMSEKRKKQIEEVLETWKRSKSIKSRDSNYCTKGHLMTEENSIFVDRSKLGRSSYTVCRACKYGTSIGDPMVLGL